MEDKIKDDYNDISSNHDLKERDHVSESNDEQPIDDFEILQTKLNNMDEQAFDNELGTKGDKKDGENRYSIDSPKKKMEEDTNFNFTNSETKDNPSDLSRPPGFEFMKKCFSSSSNYSTSFARRNASTNLPSFSFLICMDRETLERHVTLEEIKEAVWDCGSSKAPGPDGYSFAFVKKYWGTIQKDLYDFVNLFFASCVMPNVANSSFFQHHIPKSAFIAGRQILDGPVILSEIIECPTSEFSIKAVVLSRNPLSPFLFILVMEGLHNAFEEAVGNGLITGVNIKNSTINVSHLFYADDVIITTDWNAKDMDNIIRVLHVFYLASGLKINIHKSNIYGIGVNKDEVLSMASNAGCMAGDIPFNYLGLPIGSNMKSIASWKTLLIRFK
ncbi:RNA-directed DNA polymerase, eukaryota, reverse transcriptase zinc-binding domain protein [Tanacetum coccineum]